MCTSTIIYLYEGVANTALCMSSERAPSETTIKEDLRELDRASDEAKTTLKEEVLTLQGVRDTFFEMESNLRQALRVKAELYRRITQEDASFNEHDVQRDLDVNRILYEGIESADDSLDRVDEALALLSEFAKTETIVSLQKLQRWYRGFFEAVRPVLVDSAVTDDAYFDLSQVEEWDERQFVTDKEDELQEIRSLLERFEAEKEFSNDLYERVRHVCEQRLDMGELSLTLSQAAWMGTGSAGLILDSLALQVLSLVLLILSFQYNDFIVDYDEVTKKLSASNLDVLERHAKPIPEPDSR